VQEGLSSFTGTRISGTENDDFLPDFQGVIFSDCVLLFFARGFQCSGVSFLLSKN
jgi:hypothetical protein